MTRERIDCRREAAAITKALRSMVSKARALGVTNPQLFFEAESHAIFVMDGDHDGEANSDKRNAGQRQAAIVAEARLDYPDAPFDAGAW